MVWIAAPCALLLATGCDCEGTRQTLIVDMRTDLSPGMEFDWVEVGLYRTADTSGDAVRRAPNVVAARIDDARVGVRLARLDDLSPGSWWVSVRLMRGAPERGLEVVSGLRTVFIRSDERRAVTVIVTRNCSGVMCPRESDDPTHLACLGGRCVAPTCSPETPESCPPPECGADGECAPSGGVPACATGVCLAGTCGTWPDDARCAASEVCTFDGCVPREIPSSDAGPTPDAGPPNDGGPAAPDPCFEALGASCEVIAGSYLKASNTGADDGFGLSVSLSGDSLAVGAPFEESDATGVGGPDNDNASNSGAVYVFVRDRSGTWSQQAYLKASNTGAGDFFGISVSLSGDALAVGAPSEDSDATGVDGPDNDNASNSGAVYVFVRDGSGTWSQQAYLKASNTGAGDEFGSSVSLSGDALAVGAPSEDSDGTGAGGPENDSAPDAGAVYVFVRDAASGVWSQQAYLKASNTGAGDEFASSVSLSGDTLTVGAPREDSDATGVNGPDNDNARDSGAVYVFVRDDSGAWSEHAYLKAFNTGAEDRFGWSVSLSGDTLAAAATWEDSDATGVDGADNDNAMHSGAVYVFVRDASGVWSQQAYLKASNCGVGDYFGTHVSLAADTLAVGAVGEDSDATRVDEVDNDSASNAGAVYVFVRDASGLWTQQAYLKASNTGAEDRFGCSLSLSGDALAVGAYYEDSDATGIDGPDNDDATNAGAVYLFDARPR